jgi:hypothetical protein
MTTANTTNGTIVKVKPLKKETLRITIKGDDHCDLILNKMTDEAVEDIKASQTKTGSKTKDPINMWQRLIGGLHWMDSFKNHPFLDADGKPEYTEESYYELLKSNRVGYDASGIKKGLCEAAVRVLGESKSTIINANLQIIPDKKNLVPIEFGETEIDESVITNWKGNAFLTYRTVFRNWSSTFTVEYLPSNLSIEQVIEMFQAMGFAGGIGAHRVGLKGGTNGKFYVDSVVKI